MDLQEEPMKSGIHYHIRWSNSSLDWKPFLKEGDASELAGKIKRPNESYIIVERDNDCERCKEFELKACLPSVSGYPATRMQEEEHRSPRPRRIVEPFHNAKHLDNDSPHLHP
jgi:hypothetical protein